MTLRVDFGRIVDQAFGWVRDASYYRPRPAIGWRESPSRDHSPKDVFVCRYCLLTPMDAELFVFHATLCIELKMASGNPVGALPLLAEVS